MKAYLLNTKDGNWEGLFINNLLIEEDHSLTDVKFWLKVAHVFDINTSDITIKELDYDDDKMVMNDGSFPANMTSLSGCYFDKVSDDLFPCPFCGSNPVGPVHTEDDWWIECEECLFVMEKVSKKQLISTWNKRTLDVKSFKEVQLKEQLCKCKDCVG